VACATLSAAAGAGAVAARRADAARDLPYYADSTLAPRWIARGSPALDTLHRVGDFALVDQDGRTVTRRDVAGRVYVASFFYTTCRQLCPTVRAGLARVRDTFRDDTGVAILSHTVAPEADRVAALAHYARLNGVAAPGWRLLTGTRAEIERLARERYFVELADGSLAHTEALVLVDGAGRLRGMYAGSLPYEVTQLLDDVRRLRSRPGDR
jgi:protein SCO1/2